MASSDSHERTFICQRRRPNLSLAGLAGSYQIQFLVYRE